jgi:hypothetical protein
LFSIESAFGMQFIENERAEFKNIGELKVLREKRSAF